MKSDDLFKAIGEINDRLIDEAKPEKNHNNYRTMFKWAVSIAVCICLAFTGNAIIKDFVQRDTKLMKLDLSSIVFEPVGMGYEGTDDLCLNNSDDINPWTKDADIENLPVYKNGRYNDGKLSQIYFSAEDLKKQTEDFARALKLDIIGGEAVSGENENEIYNYILQTKQGQVSVNGAASSFNINRGYEYLLNEYYSYYNDNNAEKISGIYKTYSVDGEFLSQEKRSYYDKGSIEENIISFNLQSHYESENENDINIRSYDFISASHLFAYYPIITWEKAQKELLEGNYVSSADESQVIGGKLSENAIADVELIYYTEGNPEYYAPYYRFSVRYYSADSDNQRYAYFYVCAVGDNYLI